MRTLFRANDIIHPNRLFKSEPIPFAYFRIERNVEVTVSGEGGKFEKQVFLEHGDAVISKTVTRLREGKTA